MKIIGLTQNQVALVDDVDYEYLMQWKWCAAWMSKGYYVMRKSSIDGKSKTIHLYTYCYC